MLGLDYIEPELREGRGELEAAIAHRLPKLVTESDLKGDLHCHTTLSDGRNSLEDMAKAARSAATSTSRSPTTRPRSGSATTCRPDELLRQVERVRELNERARRASRCWSGTEVNINTDGSLDYADEVLARARLGRRLGALVVPDGREGDDRAHHGRDGQPARRRDRPSDRAADPAARALRARRRAAGRARRGDRHDAGDQRQPRPARPGRPARAPGGRGGRDDRDQLRRARQRARSS